MGAGGDRREGLEIFKSEGAFLQRSESQRRVTLCEIGVDRNQARLLVHVYAATSCFEGSSYSGEPRVQRCEKQLMATSYKCWPDGVPINAPQDIYRLQVRRRIKMTGPYHPSSASYKQLDMRVFGNQDWVRRDR
eukprot:1128774-Prorocentrum_minimum.AAC.3